MRVHYLKKMGKIIDFFKKAFGDYEFWRGLLIGFIILLLGNFVFVRPIKMNLNSIVGQINIIYVKELVNNKEYKKAIELTSEEKIGRYPESIKLELKSLRKVSEDAVTTNK